MSLLIRQLLDAGLLHPDVKTICGEGLDFYTKEPVLKDGELEWRDGPTESLDKEVLATVDAPFKPDGGLSVLDGNLGRGVIKTSALRTPHCNIKAPAVVFEDQFELDDAFKSGKLDKDCSSCSLPRSFSDWYARTSPLNATSWGFQDRVVKVALVTDGRMSGAQVKFLQLST